MTLLMLMAVIVASAGSPGASPAATDGRPAATPAAAAIRTGLVTSEETGRPIGGATVELFDDPGPEAARARLAAGDPIGEPLGRGLTDARGRYRVEAAAGGRAVLVVGATGHERRRCGRPFRLTEARDLGECSLPAGRTISGRVVGPSNAPAAGTLVVARRSAVESVRWDSSGRLRERFGFPAAARTGPDGRFVLEGVASVPVDLHVFAPAAAPALLPRVRRDTGVEVRLTVGAEVRGQVLGPDDAPAAGAWVMAGLDGWGGIARADTKGAFRLRRVRPGDTTVIACAGEGEPGRTPIPAPSAPARVVVPAAGGGMATGLILRLRPGGRVSVRAIDAATRQPVVGASATLGRIEGAVVHRLPATPPADALRKSVDESGVARFDGLSAGSVRVGAEADGYADPGTRALDLPAGATREITLALDQAGGLAGVLHDETGSPVAGALVALLAEPAWPGRRRTGVPMPLAGHDPVTSAANGRFAFDGLPPGRELTARVTDPRFAPHEVVCAPLLPGERREGVEVRLVRGAAIVGRAVDAGGAPVAGAEVLAERQMEEAGRGFTVYGVLGRAGGRSRDRTVPPRERQLPAALAGTDGGFRLAGATDGVWSLDVGAPGFAPRRVTGVRVEGGRDADVGDVGLVPGVRLRGRVVGPAAEPVGFARVTIGSQEEWFFLKIAAGADGRFESDDLVPGRPVTVAVGADGYATWQQDGLIPPAEEMTITLGPASSVSGRVVDAGTRRGIADFTISISHTIEVGGINRSYMRTEIQAERTFHADDGRFSIDGLTPGHGVVRATAPGYRSAEAVDVLIPEAARLEDLVLALGRAVAVSGTVTDEAGAPIADALVTRREADVDRRMGGSHAGGEAVTDGDGSYTLTGLDPGAVVLDFEHGDYEPASLEVDAARDLQGVRTRLVRAAALSGTVTREPGGAPVAGAVVRARAAGDRGPAAVAPALTGADGRFVLEALPAGRYAIQAEARGLRVGKIENVVVERGVPPPPVEIRLAGGVTLRGRVNGVPEDQRGALVVAAVGSDSEVRGPAAVDSGGSFEVGGVAPGAVTLSFYQPRSSGLRVTRRVEIPDGVETYEVTLTIDEGHVIAGTVRRAGTPIGGAHVDFWNRARRSAVSATSDASGAYRAAGVSAGETQLTASQWMLGLSHSRAVTIEGDATIDIDFPVAVVAGSVREAGTLRPIEGATVTAAPAAGTGATAGGGDDRTDAAGAWRIEGLAAGTWTLTARHSGHAFATRSIDVPGDGAGGPARVDFDLEPASPLAFRVIDGVTGQPVRAVTCLVLAGGGDPLDAAAVPPVVAFDGTLTASPEGDFRIGTLAPGSYRVVIAATDLATETLHDLPVPGPPLTVTLVPPGAIRVRASGIPAGTTARAVALDAAGRPAHLVAWTPLPYVTLRPDAPSTLPNLKPGVYRLRAALPSGSAEASVEVKAGETAEADLR